MYFNVKGVCRQRFRYKVEPEKDSVKMLFQRNFLNYAKIKFLNLLGRFIVSAQLTQIAVDLFSTFYYFSWILMQRKQRDKKSYAGENLIVLVQKFQASHPRTDSERFVSALINSLALQKFSLKLIKSNACGQIKAGKQISLDVRFLMATLMN